MPGTLIRAPRLFDGASRTLLEHAFVVVDGERITGVGEQRELAGVDGFDDVVDLASDTTLLPGLINMHTHISFSSSDRVFADAVGESDPQKMLRIAENLRTALATGVTTVRDCGTWPHLALPAREAQQHGMLAGPRIIASGAITITGGHCWFCATEADDEFEVRKAVRAHVKDGVDFIKLFATGGNTTPGSDALATQYSAAQMCAATEEARRSGRRTASHAHAVDGVRTSIAARVTTIEHCSFQTTAGLGWDEELANEIVDAGIYVCHTVFQGPTKLDRGALSPQQRTLHDRRTRTIEQRLALTRRLADKGVSLIAGNDAGVGQVTFADYPGDLVLTANGCGIAPVEVLISATGTAAQALGRDDIGIIAPGKIADLLVVHGNPLDDIAAIKRPERVIARGRPAAGPRATLNVLAT